MKSIYLLVLPLALASLACLKTAVISSAPTAVPAAFISQEQPEEEPESGAVYEVPPTKTAMPDLQCAIVTAYQSLNLRTEPSEKAIVLTWLHTGQVVEVLAKEPSWWMVKAEKVTGYARAAYLKESECE